MSRNRSYAVGIVSDSRVLSIVERHSTLREAAAFARAYNRLGDDRQAVIIPHPISRAISQARAKSRAS
jgi:hypothetical protein